MVHQFGLLPRKGGFSALPSIPLTLYLVGFQLMALGPWPLAFRARGFLYFVSLFLRARARASRKPCVTTVSERFKNRLFEHFPGLFEHFPGYSNIFRVLSTGLTRSIWVLSTIKTPAFDCQYWLLYDQNARFVEHVPGHSNAFK